MRYHLFQKFFGKMVKIKETSILSTRGMTLMFGNCMYVNYILKLDEISAICVSYSAVSKLPPSLRKYQLSNIFSNLRELKSSEICNSV